MGFLDTSAIRRAEKQLEPWFQPGERVLEFDIGTTPSGHKVHCIATTRALYVVARGGDVLPVPYADIDTTRGGRSHLSFITISGRRLEIDFGRHPRGLANVVFDQWRPIAEQRRIFHVSWGRGGAKFLIVPGAGGPEIAGWRWDEGTPDDLTTSMLEEQALGELEVSLGIEPRVQCEDPRPVWMPEFIWEPPLAKAG